MEKEIVKKAVTVLKEKESGEKTTIAELINETGMIPESDMFSLTGEIIKAAKKEGFSFEPIFRRDAIIGTPWNIPYEIKRKYDKKLFTKENIKSVSYKAGAYLSCTPDIEEKIAPEEKDSQLWDSFLEELLNHAKVQNWFDFYNDYGILDGNYWRIEIEFRDGNKAVFNGSNKCPAGFRTFAKAFVTYRNSCLKK